MATAMTGEWKNTQRNRELQDKVAKAPEAFRLWAEEKKASISDLLPLNSLPDLSEVSALLEEFSKQRLTRSQGRQALDLIADLWLMKTPLQKLQPQGRPWLEQLKLLRYPRTHAQDSQPGLEKEDWPQFAKVQKRRNGDRLEYQMTIQFQDLKDLNGKLARLYKASDEQ